jgi:hypothetical protein
MEQNTAIPLFELQVDHNISAYLKETARWAKFLAILGFIFCGLMVLVALFAGSFIAAILSLGGGAAAGMGYMGGVVSFLYIVMALLSFFPCLYLYNFASRMQMALRSNDQEQLTKSFRNLKSCYRYIGIFTVIYLVLVLLVILFNLFGAFSPMRVR